MSCGSRVESQFGGQTDVEPSSSNPVYSQVGGRRRRKKKSSRRRRRSSKRKCSCECSEQCKQCLEHKCKDCNIKCVCDEMKQKRKSKRRSKRRSTRRRSTRRRSTRRRSTRRR
jgi:hypothetical protein